MAMNYNSATPYQQALAANTAVWVTLPATRTPLTCVCIVGKAARLLPVFVNCCKGSDVEPTVQAAGASGACSPPMPPGMPLEFTLPDPAEADRIGLKTAEAGDVWITFYERG